MLWYIHIYICDRLCYDSYGKLCDSMISLSNWLLAWKQPGGCSGEKWHHCKCPLVNWGQRCRCELPGPRGWTDQHTYRDSPGLTEFLAVSYNLYVFKWHFMVPRKASFRAGNIFNFITPTAGGPEHVAPGDYFGAEHLWQHNHCFSLVGLGRIGFYGRARLLLPATRISWAAFPSEIG